MRQKLFEYEKPEFPSDCKYVISPSQLYKIYTEPAEWYNTVFLGNEPSFRGNTATVTGTVCHYIYELASKGLPVNREALDGQILEYAEQNPDLGLDTEQILKDYPAVATSVVNEYVLTQNNQEAITEKQMVARYSDGIYIGGTVDRIDGDTLVDFKTVGKKPNELVIPVGYKLQLLAYAYIARRSGMAINRLRIVYGVKPTKTMGARTFCVTEAITGDSECLLNETLSLAETLLNLAEKYPEMKPVILRYKDAKERMERLCIQQ